jgi:hypothetical protein
VDLGSFELDDGTELPELTVAYRHDGRAPAEAPQILVVHALTGSADAAGDWWEPLIGEGRALDTARYGVLCANLLGGRYGTTGPDSPNRQRAGHCSGDFSRHHTRPGAGLVATPRHAPDRARAGVGWLTRQRDRPRDASRGRPLSTVVPIAARPVRWPSPGTISVG